MDRRYIYLTQFLDLCQSAIVYYNILNTYCLCIRVFLLFSAVQYQPHTVYLVAYMFCFLGTVYQYNSKVSFVYRMSNQSVHLPTITTTSPPPPPPDNPLVTTLSIFNRYPNPSVPTNVLASLYCFPRRITHIPVCIIPFCIYQTNDAQR